MLDVMIDKKGSVSRVEILNSESLLLNKPAVEAVSQWQYEPFLLDGKPTPAVFTVTVKSKLQ